LSIDDDQRHWFLTNVSDVLQSVRTDVWVAPPTRGPLVTRLNEWLLKQATCFPGTM
jgi:hypothetical protein